MQTESTAPADPRSTSRRPWAAAAALFLCFSILYIGLRSGQYNGDMVWQSRVAEGTKDIELQPDHLFYSPMVRAIYDAWQALGLPGRAHVALQTVNGLFGGMIVAILFLILWRLTKRASLSAFAAAFFGLTPYVWHHATDVETYASTKAFQLLAIYFMFVLASRTERARPYLLAVVVAVLHALATYLQYLHVMLVPAAVVACLLSVRAGWRRRLGVAAVYLLVVGLLVWIPFLYVAWELEGVSDLAGLKAWLTSPGYGWPVGARMGWVKTPLKTGARFLNWATPLELPTHEAKRVLFGQLAPTDYLSAVWPRIPFVLALGAVQLALIWRLVRAWRHILASWRNVMIVALCIIVFYQGFAIYWGGNFMGLAMPAYVVLLALAYADAHRNRHEDKFAGVLSVAVPWVLAVVATAGLVFGYIPEHDPRNNEALQEVKAVSARLTRDDLMLGPGGCIASEYWAYFAPEKRTFWLMHHVGHKEGDRLGHMLRTADRKIARTLRLGGRVYVHRLYAEEDEMTRPWNELVFAGIKRHDVVAHFRRYPHREIEIAGYRYREITGLPGE